MASSVQGCGGFGAESDYLPGSAGGEMERKLAERDEAAARAEARRAALKKIAVFGAYTAPFMLASFTATKALAASGGGGGGGCCWIDARLASGKPVGAAEVGDLLLMMNDAGSGTYTGRVTEVSRSIQPSLTFETASGIRLTCSYSTPMPVSRAGRVDYLAARDCLVGDLLPVQDDEGFRWEPLTGLEEAGRLPVQLITANDGVFAAGDAAGRHIFTHNVKPP